jgi:hypothetical protein
LATQREKGSIGSLRRIAEARIPEEPGARKPRAGLVLSETEGIRAGAVGQLAVLPR